ncbi:N-acetyl sugar amidotransferase, partial [bacterium]|nr:N-acetyl sugar amidotransferase [bacterium]
MKYCQACVLPDTRPNLTIGADGICNACQTHGTKREIDWAAREVAFRAVIERAKVRSQGYDCVIPVSGGKDSTWQVVTCLKYGLNPLAVTWKTPARTAIGQQNLDNLISLGVDHIDYQINPKVERQFLYEALVRYGSTAIPMHMALFNIPLKIAAKFAIPLVIWGENSAFEYGNRDDEQTGFQLDEAWLRTYGVTHGTTAENWIGDRLTRTDLTPYFGVSAQELQDKGVLAIFLGYYFPWDVELSLQVAIAHGFQRASTARTGYYNYADIDDDFISIHHWLKWYKFGFTRTFDNLSLEIRNGRLSREEAIAILRDRGDETPHEDIAKFCDFVGISAAHFFEIAERFRNL